MQKYIEYFKYIVKHKYYVFKECIKEGRKWGLKTNIGRSMFIHAFTHDISKFSPKEFKQYAEYFYGDRNNEIEFKKAWGHHYSHNKHHWEFWRGVDIPDKYILQMICDWKAMSKGKYIDCLKWYCSNYDNIYITHNSRVELDFRLGLTGECVIFNATWQDCCDSFRITREEDLQRIISNSPGK